MNKNGFVNIPLILLVVIVVGVVGYFVFTDLSKENIFPSDTKSEAQIPAFPVKLDTSGAPAAPADQALAEVTVLLQKDEEWEIRVDKIRDYSRYPDATNIELKEGDIISVRSNGWINTFKDNKIECPEGYTSSPKPTPAYPINQPQPTSPEPKITIGEKYLSKLLFVRCSNGLCQSTGWSVWLYNPSPVVEEYECVRSRNISPSVMPPVSPINTPSPVIPQQ